MNFLIFQDENKQIALGTSKLNYLDPRISVAWCKKFEVPIEKVFNKTQRDKFKWAIEMADKDYEFWMLIDYYYLIHCIICVICIHQSCFKSVWVSLSLFEVGYFYHQVEFCFYNLYDWNQTTNLCSSSGCYHLFSIYFQHNGTGLLT